MNAWMQADAALTDGHEEEHVLDMLLGRLEGSTTERLAAIDGAVLVGRTDDLPLTALEAVGRRAARLLGGDGDTVELEGRGRWSPVDRVIQRWMHGEPHSLVGLWSGIVSTGGPEDEPLLHALPHTGRVVADALQHLGTRALLAAWTGETVEIAELTDDSDTALRQAQQAVNGALRVAPWVSAVVPVRWQGGPALDVRIWVNGPEPTWQTVVPLDDRPVPVPALAGPLTERLLEHEHAAVRRWVTGLGRQLPPTNADKLAALGLLATFILVTTETRDITPADVQAWNDRVAGSSLASVRLPTSPVHEQRMLAEREVLAAALAALGQRLTVGQKTELAHLLGDLAEQNGAPAATVPHVLDLLELGPEIATSVRLDP